jgi:hypothetical protein
MAKPRRAKRAATPPPAWHGLWWLVAPVAALFAFRSASSFEHVGDARFLILENDWVKSLAYASETLSRDYFWSSSGNVIPYWRPFTKLSWLVEWQAFGAWGGGYAWVNVAWHALGIGGVGMLARSVGLPRGASLAAALIFALHPVAIEPVSLIMARSDVVATTGSTWSVVAWLRWRAHGGELRGHALAWLAVHVLACMLAFGSKESAIAIPLALTALALLSRDAVPDRRRHWLTLLPAGTLGLAYFWLRRAVLERQMPGLSATDLAIDPLRIASGLGFYLRNTWPLSLRSSLRDLPIAEARSGSFWLLTLATLGAFAAVGFFAWRLRRRDVLGLMAWLLCALAPVLVVRHIAVITDATKYSLADRWLYAALPPACVIWVWLALELGGRAAAWREALAPRRLAIGASVVLCVWATKLSIDATADRAELASDLAMLDNEDRVFYFAVPERFRSTEDHCRYHERRMVRALVRQRPAEALSYAPEASARCPGRPELDAHQLEALVALGRFDAAEPVARRLMRSPPRDRRGHGRIAALSARTLVERGATEEAASLYETAIRFGTAECRNLIDVAEAARTAGRLVEAARHATRAYECGGRRDSSLLVAALTWLLSAGDRDQARSLVEQLEKLALPADQAEQVVAARRALSAGAPEPLLEPRRAPP